MTPGQKKYWDALMKAYDNRVVEIIKHSMGYSVTPDPKK